VLNAATTFEAGWATMSFFPLGSSATAIPAISLVHRLGGGYTTRVNLLSGSTYFSSAATYYGLPVVGFAAVTFKNGNVGGSLSNYGGNFNHKSTRRVIDYYVLGN